MQDKPWWFESSLDPRTPIWAPRSDDGALAAPSQARPGVAGVTLTGFAPVDALFAGSRWLGSELAFSFPTSVGHYADYDHGRPALDTLSPLSGIFRDAFRQVMGGGDFEGAGPRFGFGSVASFTNMNFVEESGGQGTLRIAASEIDRVGFGYYPHDSGEAGDVFLNAGYMDNFASPRAGEYTWYTVLHEVGHALGLKHAHQVGGPANAAVPSVWDSPEFTVMTYRSFVGSPAQDYSIADGSYAQTFMMLDIMALQHLYGADFTTNAGNTSYRWNPATGEMSLNGVGQGAPAANKVFLTVWDGGGVDTYDMSNYGGAVTIDLRPGGFSKTGTPGQLAQLGAGQVARGNVFNAFQYRADARSLIENAVGTAFNDTLVGNQAVNLLVGGKGDDTYYVQTATDRIVENSGGGVDSVVADSSYSLAGQYIEKLYLVGTGASNGTGNSLDNLLIGNAGRNVLTGGKGNDVYEIQTEGDRVVENAGEGDDHVYSDISFNLSGQHIEHLTLKGNAVRATGNSLANTLTGTGLDNILDGGAGNDVLIGLGGADTMIGGAGNDRFIVDHARDRAVEANRGGDDRVVASVSYSLAGSYVERLDLVGSAKLNGAGNSLDNILTGNAGINVLTGGTGDDTFHVQTRGDRAVELNGEGDDHVLSSVDYSLAGQFIERLTLTGTATSGTGNSLANTIAGNASNNILDGGSGVDVMTGGKGNDRYYVDNARDRAVELNGEGDDRVIASVSYDLGGTFVERLDLAGSGHIHATGNSLANILTGNAGNNRLEGGGGADILIGGAGFDRYVYRSVTDSTLSASDRIAELAYGDRLDLSAIDADSQANGDQAFTLVDAFSGRRGQATLDYSAATQLTTLLIDTDGDRDADMRILIGGDANEDRIVW